MAKQLLRAQKVIDCTGAPPVENGAILIDGERIIAVGKESDIRQGADIEVIDCSGQVLMPGIIDCHNHLSLDTTLENHLFRMADPVPELTLRAVSTLKVDLLAGVTTARCCGDKAFIDIACKRAVESDRIQGPRLRVATRGIRASHGHGYVGYAFDGLEPIRSAVRENILAGADFIKLYITGTTKGDGSLPAFLSKSEISLAVQEARRVGRKTATHCIGGQGMEWALELGIDSIEHAYFISDAQIDRLGATHSRLVMTPSPFFIEDRLETLPKHLADGFRRERDGVAERLRAIIGSGIAFAVGTDGRHGGMAQEARLLVDLGATPEDVLVAITRNGAAVCGLEDQTGTLEPGKLADIIGVLGNPLKDIGALQNVRTVMKAGRIYKFSSPG